MYRERESIQRRRWLSATHLAELHQSERRQSSRTTLRGLHFRADLAVEQKSEQIRGMRDRASVHQGRTEVRSSRCAVGHLAQRTHTDLGIPAAHHRPVVVIQNLAFTSLLQAHTEL